MQPDEPRFCPHCGAALATREAHGRRRPACPACDFIHYADPKLAVGVLVEDGRGRLLYTRRNHEPMMGAWAFPGGFVDRGEDLRAAAVREVWEETGLEIELGALLGVFSREGDPVVFIAFHGHPRTGRLRAGSEASEVRFFAAAERPPPVFPSDRDVLAAWQALRGVG